MIRRVSSNIASQHWQMWPSPFLKQVLYMQSLPLSMLTHWHHLIYHPLPMLQHACHLYPPQLFCCFHSCHQIFCLHHHQLSKMTVSTKFHWSSTLWSFEMITTLVCCYWSYKVRFIPGIKSSHKIKPSRCRACPRGCTHIPKPDWSLLQQPINLSTCIGSWPAVSHSTSLCVIHCHFECPSRFLSCYPTLFAVYPHRFIKLSTSTTVKSTHVKYTTTPSQCSTINTIQSHSLLLPAAYPTVQNPHAHLLYYLPPPSCQRYALSPYNTLQKDPNLHS